MDFIADLLLQPIIIETLGGIFVQQPAHRVEVDEIRIEGLQPLALLVALLYYGVNGNDQKRHEQSPARQVDFPECGCRAEDPNRPEWHSGAGSRGWRLLCRHRC